MAQLFTNLVKKYYFVTDTVIYDIKNVNDKDKCGICAGFNDDGTIKPIEDLIEIFPYIELTYETSDGTEKKKYLWLQDFISDGDLYKNDVFECTPNLHDDGATTFLERYLNKVKKEAYLFIKGGYQKPYIRSKFPKFLNEVPYTDSINGEDVTVTAVSLTSEQQILSDDNIDVLWKDVAEERAKDAANKILNRNGQEVDTLTLTVKDL